MITALADPLNRLALSAMLCGQLLTGCASYTVPAAVRTSTGEVFVGTTTASLRGGTFEVQNPDESVRCTGNYDALDTRPTISAPVTCTDGRSGTAIVTRTQDMQAGSGIITLSDGTTGEVAFGRLAGNVSRPQQLQLSQAVTNEVVRTPVRSSNTSAARHVPIRAPRRGSCDCPYDITSNGQSCGGRSAWSRPGGRNPVCYKS